MRPWVVDKDAEEQVCVSLVGTDSLAIPQITTGDMFSIFKLRRY